MSSIVAAASWSTTPRTGSPARAVDDHVAILTAVLDEQGYLADFESVTDGHFRINLHNCAIWAVASRFPQACAAELDYLRALIPGAVVQRATHKTSGAHTCAYDIRFATASSAHASPPPF